MIKMSKLSLVMVIYLLTACSDNLSKQYDNCETVSASGSFERGWIPSWLPREAKNIQERHNIDTNAIALSFEVPNPNFQLSGVTCKKTLEAPKPYVRLTTFPPKVHKMDALKVCDKFYVYQSGQAFYLWKNES